jgi:hypothetical protein
MNKNSPLPSFWQRAEGKTAIFLLTALAGGAAFGIYRFGNLLAELLSETLFQVVAGTLLVAVLYVLLDPQTRNLTWYMFKSAMRWLTKIFVELDPLAVLRGYVAHLEANLSKMQKQIYRLRAQMHKLRELMFSNEKEIVTNLSEAQQAQNDGQQNQVIIKTRKAGRLQESNTRLGQLYQRMQVLNRVLTKMYDNSEILSEDIKDQIKVKEVEQQAISASQSAMASAMSILKGDGDKQQAFELAIEAINRDVAGKVGEMENMMNMSEKFMRSIDLQNGVFEEEGLKMLEKWEKESSLLLNAHTQTEMPPLSNSAQNSFFDLNQNAPNQEKIERPNPSGKGNHYDDFFK